MTESLNREDIDGKAYRVDMYVGFPNQTWEIIPVYVDARAGSPSVASIRGNAWFVVHGSEILCAERNTGLTFAFVREATDQPE